MFIETQTPHSPYSPPTAHLRRASLPQNGDCAVLKSFIRNAFQTGASPLRLAERVNQQGELHLIPHRADTVSELPGKVEEEEKHECPGRLR